MTHEEEPYREWEKEGVEYVMDSTGIKTRFGSRDELAKHLDGTGVQHVLATAPADTDLSLVYGINDDSYTGQEICDNASCTTKSILPVLKALLDEGIEIDEMDLLTVHAATGKELAELLRRIKTGEYSPHDVDWILDRTTGAAKATRRFFPQFTDDRFRARAARIASPDVSVSYMNILLSEASNPDEIKKILRAYADKALDGVIRLLPSLPSTKEALGDIHDAIVPLDQIEGRTMMKTVSAYDNEMGPADSAVRTGRFMEDKDNNEPVV